VLRFEPTLSATPDLGVEDQTPPIGFNIINPSNVRLERCLVRHLLAGIVPLALQNFLKRLGCCKAIQQSFEDEEDSQHFCNVWVKSSL
jgi:hypothetical protein